MYCSIDDVRSVLSGISASPDITITAANGLLDSQLIQSIVDAQVEVDLALSQFYLTPLNPVPDAVKYITIDVACYMADLTFRMSKDYGANANPIRLRYARARSLLDGIVSGQYQINVPADNLRTNNVEVINPYCGELITMKHLFGPAIHGEFGFGLVGSGTGPIFELDDITRVALP